MSIIGNAWMDAEGVWHAYAGDPKRVRIPDGAKAVAGDGDVDGFAFYEDDRIVSVELPDSVERIGAKAFENCRNLKRIRLSANLKEIGGGAFAGTALETIVYPGTVEDLDRVVLGTAWWSDGKPVVLCANGTIDFGSEPFFVKTLAFDGTKADWAGRYPPDHWLNRRVGVVRCTDGDIRNGSDPNENRATENRADGGRG